MTNQHPVSAEDAIRRASTLLGADPELLLENLEELEDGSGYRIWHYVRGGGSLIVSSTDQSVLFASSIVDPAQHVEWFQEGRRTDESSLR